MKFKWETVPVRMGRGRPIRPGGKWGHSVNAVRNGRLYVFGGHSSKDGLRSRLSRTHNLNDVFVFDTKSSIWSRLKPKGTPPSPRDSHSSTLVGRDLFVFGGTNGCETFNDLHILDTFAQVWRTPPVSGDIPPPREGHGAALIDHSLFIFGGTGTLLEDGKKKECLNDLYILDTRSFQWTKAQTSGISPAPRNGSTCIAFLEMLVIFGGTDDCGLINRYFSDVMVLDTNTMLWEELVTVGEMPISRAGHTTVTLDKYLLVFGGCTRVGALTDDVYMLDLVSGFWQKAYPSGEGPCPSFAGAGVCFDEGGGLFVFIGGLDREVEPLCDMYNLTIYRHENVDNGRMHVQAESVRGNDPQEVCSISLPEDLHPGMDDFHRPDNTASDIPSEAQITKAFDYGYQIKASVDGKSLRGVLFTQNPSPLNAVHRSLVKKKVQHQSKCRAAAKNLPSKSRSTSESAA